MHVCDILKVVIVDAHPLSAVSAHIPAAAGSEVQDELGGHAAGCMAPLCLF